MIYQFPFDAEFFNSLSKNMQTMISQVQKAMGNAQYAINVVAQGVKKIPESTKTLAESGWYLPLNFHPVIVNRMAEHIKEGNSNLADIEMIAFLDDELSNIQKQINIRFPHRSKAINESLKAHKNGDCYLSIPVFFAQIEGICRELTGARFFKLKKNQSKTAQWLNNFNSDSILRMLLEPLGITGPMRQSQDSSNPIGINRHDVLHGDCNDYGESKINSYKVLSLLNYVSDTVYEAKKRLDDKN
jgi:hypothetical protein